MTSRSARCRWLRSRSCRRTSDGWDGLPLGVLARRRLQLRLQRVVHRGAAALGNVDYNYGKGNVSSRTNEIAATEAVPEAGTKIAESVGTDWAAYTRQAPGMSAFALEDGVVYHTYSAYARGLDALWGIYQWLDRAPPDATRRRSGFARHDEYGPALNRLMQLKPYFPVKF